MTSKSYQSTFKLFNKILIQASIPKSRPLHWFSYSKDNNTKDIRIISLEKVVYDLDLYYYRFCIGLLSLTIGW